MKASPITTKSASDLRNKAEKLLLKQQSASSSHPSEADGLSLIHELEVHQIELEMQNEELIKVNAEKDKFFSILAHDLRGPFSSFLGLTRIFSEEISEMKHKEAQKLANSLRDSAATVYHLIENLLEWARLQRGLIEFRPVSVPLAGVIKETVASLSWMAKLKEQEIIIQVPDDLLVKVDIASLESTLRNLISNALKFSFRGGHVIISAHLLHGIYVETVIKDEGLGMSPELLNSLFKIDARSG